MIVRLSHDRFCTFMPRIDALMQQPICHSHLTFCSAPDETRVHVCQGHHTNYTAIESLPMSFASIYMLFTKESEAKVVSLH